MIRVMATLARSGLVFLGKTYEELAAFARVSFSRMRNERFSGVIAILSSRASQPMAQSKRGGLRLTVFFNCVSDNSPLVLSACQMAPAVVPISSCTVISLSFVRTFSS